MTLYAFFIWFVVSVVAGGFAMAAADLVRGHRADRAEARR